MRPVTQSPQQRVEKLGILDCEVYSASDTSEA